MTMCLSCKWAEPALFVQGQLQPMEPNVIEAMTAHHHAALVSGTPRPPPLFALM